MNWLSFSVVSCFFFGLCGIFLSKASAKGAFGTAVVYASIPCVVALIALACKLGTVRLDRQSFTLAVLAGFCVCVAALLQLFAFERWPGKYPLIILVTSLNPALVIAFAVLTGSRFQLREWLGILLALIAVILITWQPQAAKP